VVPWIKNVERAFKVGKHGEQLTQLQWIFEKTDDAYFPLGVKGSYRAYSSPTVVEIWPKDRFVWEGTPPETLVPYIPVSLSAPTHPTAEENGGRGAPSGMFILKDVPHYALAPSKFVADKRSELEKAVNYAQAIQKNPKDIEEWITYANLAPLNDSIDDYMRRDDKK
jgi:hypothetical protein